MNQYFEWSRYVMWTGCLTFETNFVQFAGQPPLELSVGAAAT